MEQEFITKSECEIANKYRDREMKQIITRLSSLENKWNVVLVLLIANLLAVIVGLLKGIGQ